MDLLEFFECPTLEGLSWDLDIPSYNFNFDVLETLPDTELSNTCPIVYFDIETSGFESTADILQIAAKCKNSLFNVYIKPTQNVNPKATEVTGLHHYKGGLYYKNKKLPAVSQKKALKAFSNYLKEFTSDCLLVAHNGDKFDVPRLLKLIVYHDMLDDFRIIHSFSDSLKVLQKVLPDRKGPGKFKLSTLAEDFLNIHCTDEKFHTATFDVEILEKIVSSCKIKNQLIEHRKTLKQHLYEVFTFEKNKNGLRNLYEFKNIVPPGTLKKLANAEITTKSLIEMYVKGGEKQIVSLLTQCNEKNQPLVTKNKRIINKILDHIKSIM